MWTEEKLRALPAEQLRQVYDNACTRDTHDAVDITALIDWIGVPLKKRAMALDSKLGKKMQALIFSDAARAAAINAATHGLPPLGAIDPLLQKSMGEDYGPHNDSLLQAGNIVAMLMAQNAWSKTGRLGAMPEGCHLRVGALFQQASDKK